MFGRTEIASTLIASAFSMAIKFATIRSERKFFCVQKYVAFAQHNYDRPSLNLFTQKQDRIGLRIIGCNSVLVRRSLDKI